MTTAPKFQLGTQAKLWVESVLIGLTFVRWDRFVPFDVGLRVFGWIPRQDGRSDFVVLDLIWVGQKAILIATSSAKYSAQIAAYLELPHSDCRRVETLELDIPNVIKEVK